MKKIYILLALIFFSCTYFETLAINNTKPSVKLRKEIQNKDEKIFLKHADECLSIIEMGAKADSITGVAMVAFIPGDNVTESWISKMKVVGRLVDSKANYLAIVYSKASEMAVTFKDSGNKERKTIIGEFGYQGGVIVKVRFGYLIGVFSGGSSQQDADVSRKGIEWLAKYY